MSRAHAALPQLRAEGQKLRRKKIWMVPGAFLTLLFLWMLWMFLRADERDLSQGYTSLLYQLPMLNAILVPTLLAVVASRICDMEIKGNTLKLLGTLQRKRPIYRCKYFYGLLYLLLFSVGEALLILLSARIFSFTEALPLIKWLLHLLVTFAVGAVLLSVQQVLSLCWENQLAPLIVGICGSFLGLFSMFFPRAIARFVLWGYFAMFPTLGMNWEESTRITTYYEISFPAGEFLLFLAAGILIYFVGETIFARREA